MQILLHDKLDEIINQGTIVPVTEPTDWGSSLTYPWKANSHLHTCLDPNGSNPSYQMEPFYNPNGEEITHKLAGNTCFTKLDGASLYLCTVLE